MIFPTSGILSRIMGGGETKQDQKNLEETKVT